MTYRQDPSFTLPTGPSIEIGKNAMSIPQFSNDTFKGNERSSTAEIEHSTEKQTSETAQKDQQSPVMRQKNSPHQPTTSSKHTQATELKPNEKNTNCSVPRHTTRVNDEDVWNYLNAQQEKAKLQAQLKKLGQANPSVATTITEPVLSRRDSDQKSMPSCESADSSEKNNLFDQQGFTPLHYAISRKDRAAVKKLILDNADPMAFKEGCTTPLMHAIKHWPEFVAELVTEIPQERCKSSENADHPELHLAAHSPKLLCILQDAGFDDCSDKNGETA
ncbi:MAG: hypothetical protein ACKOA0_05770, partial [Burkholderiaceae bacterium]